MGHKAAHGQEPPEAAASTVDSWSSKDEKIVVEEPRPGAQYDLRMHSRLEAPTEVG